MKTNKPIAGQTSEYAADAILSSLQKHQRRSRLLTGGAFLFGALSILASMLLVMGYFVLYRPKQLQMLNDFGMAVKSVQSSPKSAATSSAPSASPNQETLSQRDNYDFPHIQVVMTHFLSMYMMLLAVAVGLLGLGTVVLLALVIVQRQQTMAHVAANLTQISAQLKTLSAEQNN